MFFFWSPELHSSFGLGPLLYGSVFLPSDHKEVLLHVIEMSETKFKRKRFKFFWIQLVKFCSQSWMKGSKVVQYVIVFVTLETKQNPWI